jgi:predicted alpha/beta hydrolase
MDVRTAVLVNSATAVKRRYYGPFARYPAGEGFTVQAAAAA